ncbi:hypothetical protein DXG01_017214 [Tephrocybe rancida]|nr:hypothetical protein DXG01_017214 [Tephrocybe rancida]
MPSSKNSNEAAVDSTEGDSNTQANASPLRKSARVPAIDAKSLTASGDFVVRIKRKHSSPSPPDTPRAALPRSSKPTRVSVKRKRSCSHDSLPSVPAPVPGPSSKNIPAAVLDSIQEFFSFRYKPLKKAREGHTPSDNTRSPGVFDTHLTQEYRLMHVVKLKSMPEDLASVAQNALDGFTGKLPVANKTAGFPTKGSLSDWRMDSAYANVQTEADVERIYGETVAKACSTVAGTLAYGHKSWSPGCLQWSFRPKEPPIKGNPVAKNQGAADGFLNILKTGTTPLSKTQQQVFNAFPVLAIWEFKNLNFCCDPSPTATIQGAVDSFLGGLFPWANCEFDGQCVALHPKYARTASVMGWDAENPPCESYRQSRDTPAYRALLKARISEADRDVKSAKMRKERAEMKAQRDKAKKARTRAKAKAKMLGQEDSGSDTEVDEPRISDTNSKSTVIHQPGLEKSGMEPIVNFKAGSRDLLQQVWTEAVRHDATFVVIHTGNTEVFCIRDRLTQTLYVSEVIEINKCSNYMQIHTGFMIAAVRDAEDRAHLLNTRSMPATWRLPPSTGNARILNLKDTKDPEEAQKELLLEAQRRTWLKFHTPENLDYLPFNKGLYHRLEGATLDQFGLESREVSLAPSARTTAVDRLPREPSVPLSLDGSESASPESSTTPEPSPSQTLHALTYAMFTKHQYSIVDHNQDTPLDYNTVYQLYVSERPFYGQHICRGTLRIHGTLFATTFKSAHHPVLMIKNASNTRDMKLLKQEYQVLCQLNKALIPGVPQAYGLYHHPNVGDRHQSFAALVMEDRGISLRKVVSVIKSNLASNTGGRAQKKRKHRKDMDATAEPVCIVTDAQRSDIRFRKRFHLILDGLHNAGFAHGNLTSNSLILRGDGVSTLSADVSVVGFKQSVRLEASTREEVILNEKRRLERLLADATMPSIYHQARVKRWESLDTSQKQL